MIQDKFFLVDSKVIKKINKNFQIEKEISTAPGIHNLQLGLLGNVNDNFEEGSIDASQKLSNGNIIIAMKTFFLILMK